MGRRDSSAGEAGNTELQAPILACCRPAAPGWVLVVLFAPMGGFLLATAPSLAPDIAGQWLCGCFGAALLLTAALLAAWQLRARVIASGTGLRWRDLGRWRSVPWAQVLDYYEKPFPRGQQLVIETNAGTIRLSEQGWSGLAPLRCAVQQHAVAAVAAEWLPLGTRPQERWPLVFGYHRVDERGMAVVFWLGALAAVAMAADLFSPAHLRGVIDIWRNLGWPLGLLGGIVWLGFGLILPVMILPMGLIPREMRRRRDHRIVADAGGLVFQGSGPPVAANWSEITDCYGAPLPGRLHFGWRSVVVTPRGTFDFTPYMRDAVVLKRMIAHHARNPEASEWRARTDTDEVLGGAPSRRGRDASGRDERIYHYRTRTNRALLCFLTAIALIHALLSALLSRAAVPIQSDSGQRIFAGILEVLACWGWWRYFSASVRTTARGITQYTLFGRRFIPWDQVRDYHQCGGDVYVFRIVTGAGTRIWFWLGIADADALNDEIARRSVLCPRNGWEQKTSASR